MYSVFHTPRRMIACYVAKIASMPHNVYINWKKGNNIKCTFVAPMIPYPKGMNAMVYLPVY